jgi:hydrogenase maturation protease
MKPLVLGLGNDLLSDDAIGVIAARELSEELAGEADVIESSLSGIALLDLLVGYKKVVIIDAIQLSHFPPGTVIELSLDDLRSVPSPSPHYAGLPEMLRLARELQLEFPGEIKVVAIEVADPYTVGGGLSPSVADALGNVKHCVKSYLLNWRNEDSMASDGNRIPS